MPRFLTSPRFLLPVMIILGLMIFGLRANDLWDEASSGHLFARSALAQTGSAAPAPSAAPAAPAPSPAPAPDAGKSSLETLPGGGAASDEDVSPAEMEVLKQLAARREELDKRARDLDTRENLIKVAELRVDQKIKDMETLRLQLQSMVNQVSEGQAQQLDNLVKIYETMKPEEAANIFNTLDMPVLLNVILRMKPKSTAPILAKMSSEKAKEVTVALTKQDQLPQIK